MGKNMVLWPARQFAEDIEFHHLCEDSKLAVVKCNRFFFHKSNLQGSDLRKVQEQPTALVTPAHGPMWGGQRLDVQILPGNLRPTSMTICGKPVDCNQAVMLTPALGNISNVSPGQCNALISGSVEVQCASGNLKTVQQYTNHGLWDWTADAGTADMTAFDTTAVDAGDFLVMLHVDICLCGCKSDLACSSS